MMFELLLGAALQAVPPGQAVTIHQGNSIDVPNEIAPAVLPYLMCVMEGVNASSPLSSSDEVRTAQLRAMEDCSPVRQEAKADAMKMLSGSKIPAGKRDAFVEEALTRLAHIHDGLAVQLDAARQPGGSVK